MQADSAMRALLNTALLGIERCEAQLVRPRMANIAKKTTVRFADANAAGREADKDHVLPIVAESEGSLRSRSGPPYGRDGRGRPTRDDIDEECEGELHGPHNDNLLEHKWSANRDRAMEPRSRRPAGRPAEEPKVQEGYESENEQEIAEHSMDHTPYRNWCPSCARARSIGTPHKARRRDAQDVPIFGFDQFRSLELS